jgi:hypothetical protein
LDIKKDVQLMCGQFHDTGMSAYADDTAMDDERTEDEVLHCNRLQAEEDGLIVSDSEDEVEDDDEELEVDAGSEIKNKMYNNPDCNNNISRCLRVVPLKDVQASPCLQTCGV